RPVSLFSCGASVCGTEAGQCSPPALHSTWLFQGQPLDPSHQSGVELSPGSLSLSSLQPALTGSYQLHHQPARTSAHC
ncbi:hypothetical protein M9458_037058, partial [Cirrhinus mrigala]